ncbi:MAG: hypothetical protein ACI4AM_04405 [Muribaculaceae bacterium]
MKKAILSLACAAIALAAQAITGNVLEGKSLRGFHPDWQAGQPIETIEVGPAIHFGPSRAETQSMEYTLAGDPYTAINYQDQTVAMVMAYGFQFTAAEATKYAGNQIDYVSFYTATNGDDHKNHIKSVTVCLAYDLQSEPFYTETFTGLPEEHFTKVQADLSTPYIIEAGKEFYVYLRFLIYDTSDIPVVIDYTNHSGDEGGWVGVGNSTSAISWDNIASYFGFVCLAAGISGTSLPANEMAVTNYAVDPAVEQNQAFDLLVMLKNTATNAITSFEYVVTVGNNEPVTMSYDIPGEFRFNQETMFQVSNLSYATASPDPITITFEVTKVNGEANNSTKPSISCQTVVLPEGETYVRNVVIEEATGTWCGYCPAGLVGMEAVREAYPDGELIPVAVHGPSRTQDPMYASTYGKVYTFLYNAYGVPSAILNRSVEVFPFPLEEIESYYEMVRRVPGLATVSATAEFSDDKSTLNIHTTFAFCFNDNSEKSIYRLAYGITEDNVGPYDQNNYYSGESEDVGGWENKPSTVSTIYNDVARQLNSYTGILNSVPGTIVAGQEYTHDYTLSLGNTITNKDNINLIVYLLNTETGEIENAFTIKARDLAGVHDVIVDEPTDAPVEYYNLQGIRVANPAHGQIYIQRQGTTATKVRF